MFRTFVSSSVWPRPFWVGAPPSPPNGTPTCPGLISQRRALISKRLALICPGQWAPSSYVRALPGRAPMCWSALPFKVLSAYSRSNTGSVQNHQKADEDHKTDHRSLFYNTLWCSPLVIRPIIRLSFLAYKYNRGVFDSTSDNRTG